MFFSYFTANNLYGYAMSQRLPIGAYKWLDERVIEENFNTSTYENNVSSILNLPDDSDEGYIFEVDLHYPSELHDMHNDFPFCPEKRGIPDITKNDKLLLTFYDKKNYVVHYSMLKLAIENGLILKKVHRVLQFKQIAWLKPYIDLNTQLRAQSKNNFERDFFKLLNNTIYGKSIENIRLRSDIRLADKWDGKKTGATYLISQPNFKKCIIFDENLISVELHRTHIKMDKPIIVGMCVLDISKVLMYKFLYNYLKPKYGPNVLVTYTDTDAYILDIKTIDVYADIRVNTDPFDTWDYEPDNIFGIKRCNNKVLGKFKDELKGQIASEFVGLRSKCYALRTAGKIDKLKKAKGIKKNVLRDKVSFEDYLKCVKENCIEIRKQYTIRSKSHDVYTISTTKIALNPFDDKRYIITPDCIDTLAWGHYKITDEKMVCARQNVLDNNQKVKEFMKKNHIISSSGSSRK